MYFMGTEKWVMKWDTGYKNTPYNGTTFGNTIFNSNYNDISYFSSLNVFRTYLYTLFHRQILYICFHFKSFKYFMKRKIHTYRNPRNGWWTELPVTKILPTIALRMAIQYSTTSTMIPQALHLMVFIHTYIPYIYYGQKRDLGF